MARDFALDAKRLLARAPNAQDITAGVESSRGPVDIEDRLQPDAGGERVVKVTVMSIPAADLPSLVRGTHTACKVGRPGHWTDYVIRDFELVEDGTVKELILAERAVPS